jgi:hypothetical protein
MANLATSNRTALRIVKETVFGTIPTNPALKELRYTGESLNFNQKKITSNEIRSDRNTSDLITVSADASGDIKFELSIGAFDDLIEGAFASTFSTPVSNLSTIKNGVALNSYTIQKHFQDLDTPAFQNFVGCRVGGLELSFQNGSILTGSSSIMALGASIGTSQIAGATIVQAPTQSVMNAVTNLVNIKEDNVVSTMIIKSMSLKISNNLRAQEAIGSLGHVGIALGRLDVTGNITAYFKDLTQYNKFLNNTSFALSFKCQDDTSDYYEFILPKCKFESASIVAGGIDQDLMIEGTYRAIYDSVSACTIQCNRYNA